MDVFVDLKQFGDFSYTPESGCPGQIVSAVEINTIANEVYRHNFATTKVLQRNIQSLSAKEFDDLAIDMILMSPPCQPFTRVGLKKDVLDDRTCSFLHFLNLLPNLNRKLKYILIENVKGFEKSETRNKVIETLENSEFVWQEFMLSPSQFGIPNTRHRYYLIAKRKPLCFSFERRDMMEDLPFHEDTESLKHKSCTCYPLKDVLESETDTEYMQCFLLPDKVLRRAQLLDIVTPDSTRSCCFTKAYGHYVEGTGSVLCCEKSDVISETFERSKHLEMGSTQQLDLLRNLKLRYFTPCEIARLMNFPDEHFTFPSHSNLTRKQKYRLLGNSINVYVVSQLIKCMTEGDL